MTVIIEIIEFDKLAVIWKKLKFISNLKNKPFIF